MTKLKQRLKETFYYEKSKNNKHRIEVKPHHNLLSKHCIPDSDNTFIWRNHKINSGRGNGVEAARLIEAHETAVVFNGKHKDFENMVNSAQDHPVVEGLSREIGECHGIKLKRTGILMHVGELDRGNLANGSMIFQGDGMPLLAEVVGAKANPNDSLTVVVMTSRQSIIRNIQKDTSISIQDQGLLDKGYAMWDEPKKTEEAVVICRLTQAPRPTADQEPTLFLFELTYHPGAKIDQRLIIPSDTLGQPANTK